MTANTFNAVSEAFASDVVADILRAGGSIEGGLGNDVAATFNLGSGLSTWFGALSSNSRNHIVVMGDSNVQSVSAETFRWPVQLKTDLLTFTGKADGGPGFRHLGLAEWTIPARAPITAGNPTTFNQLNLGIDPGFTPAPSNFTGTRSDLGPNGFAYFLTGQTAVFTWTLASAPASFTHDRFALFSMDDDLFVQQAEYSIDGGAFTATTFDTAPTTGPRITTQEIATPITTTLRYRGASNSFPVYLVGAAFYQTTGGSGQLVVHNLGVGGNSVSQMVGPLTGAAGPGPANRLAILNTLAPKLTIIWTGTNEHLNFPNGASGLAGQAQMTLDEFYRNYTKIAQRARLSGDALLVYPMSSDSAQVFLQNPVPNSQDDFERVARKVAYENDCGFVSIRQLWGTWSRANARARMSDDNHINEAGHNAVSKILTRAIRRVS